MSRIAPISIVLSLVLFAALWPRGDVVRYDAPVYAGVSGERSEAQTNSAISGGASGNVPWLHVEVETKYGWIYQKSVGRAWTTVSRDDTTRVNVGKLCLKLEAHGTHESCWADTSYIELQDMKRRLAAKKKKAVVTAWAEDPAIERTKVEMMP
ncbi:MAG: hypothetical protein H6505_02855 [Calditrichaeota bacterium]|nr:hypothetical protein [Calditrichota bacterium]